MKDKALKILVIMFSMMFIGNVIIIIGTITVRAEDSHLVGYWNFDEGSGNIAADSSGNSNTGTLINNPAWVNGRSGKALSFNGVNQYVEVAGNTDLNPHTSDWTISAWVNITQLTNLANSGNYGFVIMDKRQTEYEQSLTLMAIKGTSANSQARFAFIFDGSRQEAGAQSPLMNVFGWHYVVGVRRGSDLYVYVDGTEYGPNNFIILGGYLPSDTDVSSSSPIHLAYSGVWQSYGNGYCNGIIDEVRVYSKALSQQEIQTDMGGITPPPSQKGTPGFETIATIVSVATAGALVAFFRRRNGDR